jgi:hypothetical protein
MIESQKAPFSNCQFEICDLPGQCKGASRCHHPLTVVDVRQLLTERNECVEEIKRLREALAYLLLVKSHKDNAGKDEWYSKHQPKAWDKANQALSSQSASIQKLLGGE